MDRKITTIAGATAALIAGAAAAQAAPAQVPAIPSAANYAELLEPIPNAAQRLAVADAQDADRARLQQAQVTLGIGAPPPNDHHHHHHSADWYRNNGYQWDNGRWVTRDYYSHHHHHHNHDYNNGYDNQDR